MPQPVENGSVKNYILFVILAAVLVISVIAVLGGGGDNNKAFLPKLADTELTLFGNLPLFLLGLSMLSFLIHLLFKFPKISKESKFPFGHWAGGFLLLFVFLSVILSVQADSNFQFAKVAEFNKNSHEYSGYIGAVLRKKVFPPAFGTDTNAILVCAFGGIVLTGFFCFGLKIRHLVFLLKKLKIQIQKILYAMDFASSAPPPITRAVKIPDTGDFSIVKNGGVKPAKGSPFGRQDLTKFHKDGVAENSAQNSVLPKSDSDSTYIDVIEETKRQLNLAQSLGKDPREIRRLRDELDELYRIKGLNRWEDEKVGSLEIGGLLGKKTSVIASEGEVRPFSSTQLEIQSDEGVAENAVEVVGAGFARPDKSAGGWSEGETSPAKTIIPPHEPTQYDEYRVPLPAEILSAVPDQTIDYTEIELQKIGHDIESQLENFKVKGKVTGIMTGPVITRFEIEPGPGVKVSRFENLSDDLALTLRVASVRVITSIPGKSAIGIEIPNRKPQTVFCREILESPKFTKDPKRIQVVLGKDIMGDAFVTDLTKTPHLLIAGQTGAGKSVCINVLLASILFSKSPEEVRLILVDPKVVELAMYSKIPHLLSPVINSPEIAVQALKWLCVEMDRRYQVLANARVRNIEGFNDKFKDGELADEVEESERKLMPFIVVIIDELADLMMTAGKEIETSIARIAQKARAVGIHLVLATQKPVRTVITGIIKANLPSRISFKVSSQIDSRIVFDANGAEKLLGRGDMLFRSNSDPEPVRVHGAFLADAEVENLAAACSNQNVHYEQVESFDLGDEDGDAEGSLGDAGESARNRDPLIWEAARLGLEAGEISISAMQRRLGIGFSRAGRIADQLTAMGICGKANGSKPRKMLMDEEMVSNLERR
ncbi:hypothetical protein AGMMS49938_03540 [Fibrobacterales bacterium]|nr:hypothetical protein AGMMS49938_03540 [Fibrobacterales bacterium]